MEQQYAKRRKPPLMRLIAPLFIAVVGRIQTIRVRGAEHLPPTGPLIVAANHTNHFDGPVLAAVLYENGIPPCTAARADLFNIPVLGWALRQLGQIPIYRPGVKTTPLGGSGRSSLRALMEGLGEGKCLVVFPEGTFTSDPDGWPMKGKTGLARLVIAHPDTTVVPCAHWGNEELIDLDARRLRWRKLGRKKTTVDVRFGAPLDFSEFLDKTVTHDLLTDMTRMVMDAITEQLADIRR
ncbi:lysophospholipid acyltransferase family protein [Actinomycetaceae bacterium L2_0104]